MVRKSRKRAAWELAKPRLHETAVRKLVTVRHEPSSRDNRKVRRNLKLSAKGDLGPELDRFWGPLTGTA